ncbi:MAG: TonB-dependent receptor [Pseudomonadota bacterium]
MISRFRLFAAPIALSTSLLTLPQIALAQDVDVEEDDGDVILAPAIVVTGEGLDPALSNIIYSTFELEREAIVSTGSGRLEDVLSNIAGFQQFRRSDSRSANPTAQGVTLRGLGGNATSRALVLLDGVPIADPFFGYIPLASIAPETLASVRVTRGGGSGPFGAGALTGTIELESVRPRQIDGFAGSALINDRAETELSGVAVQGLGAGFASVSGRWDRGRGFFTTPDDQRVPASARAEFNNWNTALRIAAPVSDTVQVQARASLFEDDRTLRFDGADSHHDGQDISLRFVGRGDWEFDAVGYVQSRNFSNTIISSTRFVRVLDQVDTPSTGIGGKIELRPPVAEGHELRVGVDYRRSDGELFEQAFSAFTGNLRESRRAGGTNSNLGIFVEDDWEIGPVVLNGGLRLDRTSIADGFFRAFDPDGVLISETLATDRSDWGLSWRAGASFYATRRLDLRAAAYSGLRLPTLNELYRPFVVFPVVTQANADLENERLKGFEIGLGWQPINEIVLSLTAFDNEVEDAIANVTLEPNLRQRQNLPAIEAQGVEASLLAKFGAVSMDASLAYTDAEIAGEGVSLALDGNRPPQTPKFAASATLAWEPKEGLRVAGTLRHVSAQFEDDQETDVLPAATTVNLFAQVPLGRGFALTARAENLLDETIVTRNAGGAIDLGVPRTVWIGVRLGL